MLQIFALLVKYGNIDFPISITEKNAVQGSGFFLE